MINNKLTSVPKELFNLKSLEVLKLGKNKLKSIPSTNNLTNLKYL